MQLAKILMLASVSLLATGLTFYLAAWASAPVLEWIGVDSDDYASLPSELECLLASAPVETDLEAACFARAYLQPAIGESLLEFSFRASLSSGAWQVIVHPTNPSVRDAGWVVVVDRNSGVTQSDQDLP